MQKDTLKLKYIVNDSIPKTQTETYVIVDRVKKKDSFYDNPLISLLLVPIFVLIISVSYTKYVNRKKEAKEIKKLDSESNKINEEIKSIKSSFQPIVLSTIQKTQDFLLKEKVNFLKNLVELNGKLLDVEQQYLDGHPWIEDLSKYYDTLYSNFDSHIINDFKKDIVKKRYYFNQPIIDTIISISNILNSISDEKKRLESIDPFNIVMTPDDFQENMEKICDLFDELIEKIRTDLHLNSTYIQDFISKNQIEDKKTQDV